MTQFRPYQGADKRQIIDYNYLISLPTAKRFVCVSPQFIEICLYLANSRGLWRTTYSTEYQQNGYIIPDDDQFNIIENIITEGNLDMSSCEDIVTALESIAEAITNRPCCPSGETTGSRGSGSTEQPANPYDQSTTPTEPPPGFEDMEAFESHKCDQAQDILDQLESDLVGLAGISYSGQSPTGLVGALILFLLTPIPFDDLVGLAAYLIYSAFSYTFLAEMAAQIEANEDDLRCTLYLSDSASDARNDLLAALEEIALDTFTTEDDANWVMGAIEYMLPYDSTNRLFENLPTSSNGADCSACGEAPIEPFTITEGTLNSGELDLSTPSFTVGSVAGPDIGGTARYWIQMGWPTANACIELGISSSGYTRGNLASFSIGNAWYECEDGGTNTISLTNTPDDLNGVCFYPAGGVSFVWNSRTPFTVTITHGTYPCS